MEPELPEQLVRVLVPCAILRAFDAQTFKALSGGTSADLQALRDAGLLHPFAEAPAYYTLIPQARHTLLARLREQRPRDEIDLHGQAFHHYVGRMRKADPDDRHARSENESLYHLGALHDLFVEYMEWDTIISYTSLLRNRAIYALRIERWLEYYEAYTVMRAGEVAAGCGRLERLLDTDLEPALRLRVLHACHVAYVYHSRYDSALALLRMARPLARALGDTMRRSYLLLSMGQIYNDLDDHRRALSLSKLSLRLAQKSGAFYRELHARYEVGSNAMQLGLWDEAVSCLDAAEESYRRLGITRRIAMVLWAKGLIFQINGDHQRCEATFTEALESARLQNSHNVLAASDILTQLGLLAETQGEHQRALRFYSEASAQARRYDIRHWQPILQARIASITARLGQTEAAAQLWRQSIDAVENLRSSIDTEAIRVSLFGTTQYIYESFVLFLLEHGQHEEAFAYVERARSRAFLDLLARQESGGAGANPELLSPPEQLIPLKTATLAEVQGQLGRGEVVLEYFTTGVRPQGEHWLNKIPEHNRALSQAVLPRPATIIFIITRNHLRVKWIKDGPSPLRSSTHGAEQAKDLDANKLRPSALSDDPVLDMLRLDSRIDWLSKRLLAPANRWIKSYRQIYIIPHGPLHYVPFSALRRPDGFYLLTAGGPAIAFAPSATVLLHTLRDQPTAPTSANLAIGYNGQGRNQLDHAEHEALAVAQHFKGEAWVGQAAKSTALLGQRRQMRWLHIAGHAIYDQRRAHTAALLIGEGDVLSAATLLRRHDKPCRAELVTLSSCMSGFSSIAAGDELFGLQRAFLYAVAPTVICTVAKARDRVTLLVMDQFYTNLLGLNGAAATRPAEALRDALIALRTMTRDDANRRLVRYGYPPLPTGGHPTDTPFARPEYWAPFLVIGRP